MNGKAALSKGISSGSTAVFNETRRFPPRPHGRFGFIGFVPFDHENPVYVKVQLLGFEESTRR